MIDGPPRLRLIRRSGALEIYEAKGPAGEPMIVKRLDPHGAEADEIGSRRFAREMHLAAVLVHPSLPATVAHGENWIGFERLGASLSDPAMAQKWALPERARRLFATLVEAVAYCHALGVVHGDIKPAHVMFRGERPVLIDFGIASIGNGDPFTGELAGTPAWMAPEQLYPAGRNPPADIWSLAAVMMFVLTGRRPYSGSAEEVLARRRAGEKPDFAISDDVRSLDPDLWRLLDEATGPPATRPTAAAIVRPLTIRG